MKRINVENWWKLSESDKLENQIKGFIADTVEGYLNGIQFGYEPMTRAEWKNYVIETLNEEISDGMIINGIERKHMRFFGNKRFHELIDVYLDNYKSVQKHIVKGEA